MKAHWIGLALAAISAAHAQPFAYTVEDLGLPTAESTAADINEWGDVVGFVNYGGGNHEAFLARSGAVVWLGNLGRTFTQALAINDNREVVGIGRSWDEVIYPFVWTEAGGIGQRDLPIGASSATPNAINNQSEVVGVASGLAFKFSSINGYLFPGTLGGSFSNAYGINEAGEIVGRASVNSSIYRAFLYTDTDGMVDLGTLGGAVSEARGINDGGQVAGWAQTANGSIRAFRWAARGGMTNLGVTSPFTSSSGAGIDPLGRVVGVLSTPPSSATNAFLWHDGLGMVNLNAVLDPSSGWTLLTATGINSAGQVIGTGRKDGLRRAYRLTPNVNVNLNVTLADWAGPSLAGKTVRVTVNRGVTTNRVLSAGPNAQTGVLTAPLPGLGQHRVRLEVDGFLPHNVTLIAAGAVNNAAVELLGGDTNGDSTIDDADLTNLILDFGGAPTNGATDFNGDGAVDDGDLTILILNFGAGL